MDKKTNFIKQTATDYDMSIEEVEKIKEDYPNQFYEKLEEFINNRKKTGLDDLYKIQ